MYSKVVYVVKSDLAYYPPCMSQIRMLHDLGVNVEVWFGSSKQTAIEILDTLGIPWKQLRDERGKLPSKLDVVNNWLSFRKAFSKESEKLSKDTLVWFGTGETSMPLIGSLGKVDYIASALELYDDLPTKKRMFGKVAKGAIAVTACETTRAYLMRDWWNLSSVPYVFPNKPYGSALHRDMALTCDESRRIVSDLEGHRFVIYQGIFQNKEYVAALARALDELNSDLYLVMMGIDRNNISSEIKEIYGRTLSYDSVPAPKHLEVTSRAAIGVVFYDGANLNKAFCAPNKIYEYSAFGIPMLANSIPGLTGTVGAAGAAECSDFSVEELKKAIRKIERNYDEYSRSAEKFFEGTDNLKTMVAMLNHVGVETKPDRKL